jgi:hypothetical protein
VGATSITPAKLFVQQRNGATTERIFPTMGLRRVDRPVINLPMKGYPIDPFPRVFHSATYDIPVMKILVIAFTVIILFFSEFTRRQCKRRRDDLL